MNRSYGSWLLSIWLVLLAQPVHASYFDIEVTTDAGDERDARELKAAADEALALPLLQKRLEGARFRVLSKRLLDETKFPQPPAHRKYEVSIYDYSHDRLLTVNGHIGEPQSAMITESTEQPETTPDEFNEATSLVKRHPSFAAGLAVGLWRMVEAMPPTIEKVLSSPDAGRTVPVALMPRFSFTKHEIVGVNLRTRTVERYPGRAPEQAIAGGRICGPESSGQHSSHFGIPGSANIELKRAGETLWSFKAIRPSISSGAKGSGIELRDVRYKGKLILARSHMPIFNVQYDQNRCGPFRDWAYAENPFTAIGTSIANGFVKTATPPQTIIDSGSDEGNFRGVAVYEDGQELVLTSELAAGWYRYVSEYRFSENGTLKPIFKFAAVQNSCTCLAHNHHAYWRFDFDIETRGYNHIDTLGSNGWKSVEYEERDLRDNEHRAWKISNTKTSTSVILEPGPGDGMADAYGKGDVWLLAYDSAEFDDSRVLMSTEAGLNHFLNGDNIQNTDIVLWYGVHFRHVHDDVGAYTVAGPTIRAGD